jgi:hypothetical protein
MSDRSRSACPKARLPKIDAQILGRVLVVVAFAACAMQAAAQDQRTVGDCSPIVSGVGGSATVSISCPGSDSQAVEELNRTVGRLLPTIEEQRDFIAGLIRQNAGRSLQEFGALSKLAAQNLRETIRLNYKLDQPEILLSAALRFDILKGVMAPYGQRIAQLVEQQPLQPGRIRPLWPSLLPFASLQWRTPSDLWFPGPSDGQAPSFASEFSAEVYCYSAEQLQQAQGTVRVVRDLDQLPRPLFAQTVRLDPRRCGTALAVGEAYGEKNILLRAERLPPEPGSVQRRASFTSALDLLGGRCFAVVRNTGATAAAPDAVGQAMSSLVLLDLSLHVTQSLRTTMSVNRREQLQTSERHQFFRWDLPARIDGFDRTMVVNDFAPVPSPCPR